jgi:hypothetical protein
MFNQILYLRGSLVNMAWCFLQLKVETWKVAVSILNKQ